MQLWMLATPIMYPLNQVPASWMPLYVLNPMVGIIEGFRQVLIREFVIDTWDSSACRTLRLSLSGSSAGRSSKPCLNILRTRYSDAGASEHSR